MPKGQKVIDWTAENDAKLMLTILAVENVKPNCENVAKAFGGSVNAMAISNRLSRLRRKATKDGLMPKEGAAVPAKGRKNGGKGGAKTGGMVVAEGSEDETPAVKTSAKGQKVLTGRVTKARAGKKNPNSNGKVPDDVDDEAEDDGVDAAGRSGVENETYEEEDVSPGIKEEVD